MRTSASFGTREFASDFAQPLQNETFTGSSPF